MQARFITTIFLFIQTLTYCVSAQSLPYGHYVRPAVTKGFISTPNKIVLEFTETKFYIYDYPQLAAGHLVCKSGTYDILDTLLMLSFDTCVSISLNTGTLLSKSINCNDPLIISIKPNTKAININQFPEYSYISPYNIAEYDQNWPSTDWVKKYFNQKPYFKVKKCKAKKRKE